MHQVLAVDIVVPAHNEAESIGAVLRELHSVIAGLPGVRPRFVVCEDGSTDGTADVVNALGERLPIALLTSPERKGYSRAVIDGLAATTAGLIGFVDSDGQCDPADFERFLAAIPDWDMVVGYRNPRTDPWYRLAMSRAFGLVYRRIFPVALRDPSCPYVLVHRDALARVLQGGIGLLAQGFWWEFQARASFAGLKVVEVPCRHRTRLAGQSQVYRPLAIPGIAVRHLVALGRLRRELSRCDTVRVP